MSTENMGDMLDMAERYQRTFVKPLVDAVTQQIDTHLKELGTRVGAVESTLTSHTADLTKLKADQKKALIGYGVFSSAVAAGLAAGWTWVKGHWTGFLG